MRALKQWRKGLLPCKFPMKMAQASLNSGPNIGMKTNPLPSRRITDFICRRLMEYGGKRDIPARSHTWTYSINFMARPWRNWISVMPNKPARRSMVGLTNIRQG